MKLITRFKNLWKLSESTTIEKNNNILKSFSGIDQLPQSESLSYRYEGKPQAIIIKKSVIDDTIDEIIKNE